MCGSRIWSVVDKNSKIRHSSGGQPGCTCCEAKETNQFLKKTTILWPNSCSKLILKGADQISSVFIRTEAGLRHAINTCFHLKWSWVDSRPPPRTACIQEVLFGFVPFSTKPLTSGHRTLGTWESLGPPIFRVWQSEEPWSPCSTFSAKSYLEIHVHFHTRNSKENFQAFSFEHSRFSIPALFLFPFLLELCSDQKPDFKYSFIALLL